MVRIVFNILSGVSPFKQQAMKGAFSGYFFNGYRRIASHFPYFIIPVALGLPFFSYPDGKRLNAVQDTTPILHQKSVTPS
jgi:hypothetical protein